MGKIKMKNIPKIPMAVAVAFSLSGCGVLSDPAFLQALNNGLAMQGTSPAYVGYAPTYPASTSSGTSTVRSKVGSCWSNETVCGVDDSQCIANKRRERATRPRCPGG